MRNRWTAVTLILDVTFTHLANYILSFCLGFSQWRSLNMCGLPTSCHRAGDWRLCSNWNVEPWSLGKPADKLLCPSLTLGGQIGSTWITLTGRRRSVGPPEEEEGHHACLPIIALLLWWHLVMRSILFEIWRHTITRSPQRLQNCSKYVSFHWWCLACSEVQAVLCDPSQLKIPSWQRWAEVLTSGI